MRKSTKETTSKTSHLMRPALTPEARENQLISLAVDLAEKQLREGTASSQVITHYLKLGSTKDQLEKERIRKEIELADAKKKNYESNEEMKALYKDALEAMRRYSGHGNSDDYEDL